VRVEGRGLRVAGLGLRILDFGFRVKGEYLPSAILESPPREPHLQRDELHTTVEPASALCLPLALSRTHSHTHTTIALPFLTKAPLHSTVERR